MFNYVTKDMAIKIEAYCNNLLDKLKTSINKNYIIDYKLFGINENDLITKDNSNGIYDVYYIVIIEEDKTDFIDDAFYVKTIFINTFNKIDKNLDFKFNEKSKSVLSSLIDIDNDTKVNLDIGILLRDKRSHLLKKLLYLKYLTKYMWIRFNDANYINDKINNIKSKNLYNDLLNLYILKKNKYKDLGKEDLTSLNILYESTLEIYNQYR